MADFFASLKSAFSGTAPTAQNTQPTQQPAAPTEPQSTAPQAPQSPLDEYSKLWEPVATDPDSKQPTGLDPAELMKSASKVDFTKALTPEMLSKLQAGGEDALRSLPELVNRMSQQAYASGVMASSKLMETKIAEAESKFLSKLPDLIRKHNAVESTFEDNPLLKHESVQPLVAAIQQQFAVKHPGATAKELKEYTNKYLDGVAGLFRKPEPQAKGRNVDNTDWEDFAKF
jgi:hypothetical protein